MRKAKKLVTIKRGRLAGTGENNAQAKTDLAAQIDRLISAKPPYIEQRFGWTFAFYATETGWSSGVKGPVDDVGKMNFCCHSSSVYTHEEMIWSGRLHVAQNGWHPGINDDEHLKNAGLPENRYEYRDLQSWLAFQRRYIAAKDKGATSDEAYNIAHGIQLPAAVS